MIPQKRVVLRLPCDWSKLETGLEYPIYLKQRYFQLLMSQKRNITTPIGEVLNILYDRAAALKQPLNIKTTTLTNALTNSSGSLSFRSLAKVCQSAKFGDD